MKIKSAEEIAIEDGAYKLDTGVLQGYHDHYVDDFVKLIEHVQLNTIQATMEYCANKCNKNIMDETFNEGDWHMSESAKQIKETLLTSSLNPEAILKEMMK